MLPRPQETLKTEELPRLLYVGDVPVEASFHGSVVLYRLLQCYPSERMLIVEAGDLESIPARRLRDHDYRRVALWSRRVSRLVYTRINKLALCLQLFLAWCVTSPLEVVAKEFRPDAILTVAHGYSWIAAARLARLLEIPLHLIVHDDLPNAVAVPPLFRRWLDKKFGVVYRAAASRLCVSPAMVEEYWTRYGRKGIAFYPLRAPGTPNYRASERIARGTASLTVGYAGSLNTGDYIRALVVLGTSLQTLKGRLVIFGPLSAADAKSLGLDLPNVILRGRVTDADFISALGREADMLFVPMSFDEAERTATRLSFPSKLADYTAAGVPLLIRGPEYCSAVRWVRENPGIAEVVTSESETELTAALRRLTGDPEYRASLADRAATIGQEMFGYLGLSEKFFDVLKSVHRDNCLRKSCGQSSGARSAAR